MRSPGSNIHVTDIAGFEMPVKAGLEFGPVIGLDDLHAEWQASDHLIRKTNRRRLVAGIVDLEDANASAVVDGGELIQALPGTRDPLEELDVQLQAVTRLRLLVTLPRSPCRPALLIGGQPVQSMSDQSAMHRGASYRQLVKPPQIVGDPPRPKVAALSQVEDLGNALRDRPK